MRRFRQEEGFLDRLKRMASGEEEKNMELITYVDPRKVKVRFTEEESNSESDSDDWLSTQHGSRSRRPRGEYWSDVYDEQKYRKRVSRVRLNEALSRVRDHIIEMTYSWNDPILPNY